MICRLCLKDITEVINIFDEIGLELNVSGVLGKYFWFEPKSDDPISTAICNPCWLKVSDFHEFYTGVEEAHRLLTERFSFSGLTPKARKPPQKDKEKKLEKSSGSKQLAKQDAKEEMVYQFGELLEKVGMPDESLSNVAKQEQDSWASFYDDDDNDERSMDYESFAKDDELNNSADILGVTKSEVTLQQPPIERRTTRASVAASNVAASEHQVNHQSSVAITETSDSSPVKKRRGRPTKASAKAPNDKPPPRRNTYELKMKQLDEKVAQHMRLTCDVCGEEQAAFAPLRKHMEQSHGCKGYVICCNKKFYKRAHLSDHIDKHINPECYKCEECDKVFADKQCMRNHFLLKHQPEEEKIYECLECSKKFAKPYLLEQHRSVHNKSAHDCSECGKTFSSANSLTVHIKVKHHDYGTMCDICAKVIRGRAAFARHQLEHSGVVQPKVQCDKCGSWHKDKYSLQKHKRRHNDEGKLHICNICGKVAPNRSALLSHKRYVHVSARNFECGICKKAFKKAISLKEHMAMHTGEVLYNCPHCPKTFNSNANMHSHRKKMHPKEFEEARNSRRQNADRSATTSLQKATAATNRTTASNEESMLQTDEDSLPQVITIKSDDGKETHNILVTAEEFSDHDDDNDTSNGDDSIVFTIN